MNPSRIEKLLGPPKKEEHGKERGQNVLMIPIEGGDKRNKLPLLLSTSPMEEEVVRQSRNVFVLFYGKLEEVVG